VSYLTSAESPRYPHEQSDRPDWLLARDWKRTGKSRESEIWSHPAIPLLTFSRTGACRAAIGFPAEREAQRGPTKR
jgi:hypothetical protein